MCACELMLLSRAHNNVKVDIDGELVQWIENLMECQQTAACENAL